MPTGTVKVFGSNGHGFITPDEGGAPVTVQMQHMAPGSPAPREGQRVQFETRSGLIGSQALNVRAVDDAGNGGGCDPLD
jgi:cold shock CspA family protein